MYQHPNARVGWNESFENCLDKIYGVEKELYILGDLTETFLILTLRETGWILFHLLVRIKW